MKTHIVIARYNEDIQWLKYINTDLFDIFIYNKGADLTTDVKCSVIKLDNVGRESHTYLYHIVANYECLPENIIFSQAHPFDHTRNSFIDEVNHFGKNNADFFYFSKNMLTIEYDAIKNMFVEFGILHGNNWRNYHRTDSPLFKMYETLFGKFENSTLKLSFGPGAIYGVNKKVITKRGRDFFSNCIAILNNSNNLKNPDEGHCFERLWYHIFNS